MAPVVPSVVKEATLAVADGATRPEVKGFVPAAAFSDTASFAAPAMASPSATRVRTM